MTQSDYCNRYSIHRIANKYADKAECTLYSVARRYVNYHGTHSYETTLYHDEQCTQEAYKILRSCPRPMKDGIFRITNFSKTFKKYIHIVCIDNGVRREETKEIKYKYNYKKEDDDE